MGITNDSIVERKVISIISSVINNNNDWKNNKNNEIDV
jgi:hypothetical protein